MDRNLYLNKENNTFDGLALSHLSINQLHLVAVWGLGWNKSDKYLV